MSTKCDACGIDEEDCMSELTYYDGFDLCLPCARRADREGLENIWPDAPSLEKPERGARLGQGGER